MRVHYLQHVPFEGLGSIETFLRGRKHSLSATHLYLDPSFPETCNLDCLIVMGGPMGVSDEEKYPWLKREKAFIRKTMELGKPVLGICLGAQLMAHVLGAGVVKNEFREIGWFPIEFTDEARATKLGGVLPAQLEAFHWHGDRFEIPEGATPVASSEACMNQGFIMNDRIVGFQFHLETTHDSASALIENCRSELDGSRYVQSELEILSDAPRFATINDVMHSFLEKFESPWSHP